MPPLALANVIFNLDYSLLYWQHVKSPIGFANFQFYHKPARKRMAMLYRPLAFYRETCDFPPVGLEKPMEILKPFFIFSIRNYVGETYKYVNFGWDRFLGGASTQWWNTKVLWLLFSLFSVSSSRLQIAVLDRFARLITQTTCSVSYTCLFEVWSLQIYF